MTSNQLDTAHPLLNKNLRIYGKAWVMADVIRQVLSLFGDQLEWVMILVADDANAMREVLAIMEKNPEECLIIFAPPIIMHYATFEVGEDLIKLTRYPNVWVVDVLEQIADMTIMLKIVEKLKSTRTAEASKYLTISNAQKDISNRILGALQHDLKPQVIAEKWERYKKIIEQAREVFDIKPETPDENVENFILNAKREIQKVMEGEINGVYCDIDDTIFDKNNHLKEDTLNLIQRLESEGHAITIWTGGDVEIAKTRLSSTPYAKYAIVSKHDYAGVIAEMVIDNVSPEKFFIQSGITAKKFLRV